MHPSAGAGPARRLLALVALLAILVAPVTLLAPELARGPARAQVSDLGRPLVPPPGLASADQLVAQARALDLASDRVSAEVLATSPGGHEIVLLTLTAPESAAQAARQEELRTRIVDDPAGARADPALARDYRLPVLVTANVHGDEYEGSDAALRLAQEWARSADPWVQEVLERTRVHLLLSVNPDGRTAGTRRSTAGFDLNRDLITTTQPETVALRDAIVRLQPVMVLDLHGYLERPLIEPGTPPHGEALEYDLLLRHAYPNALGIEQAVLDLGLDESDGVGAPQIPLRDAAQGWDDWPPIFVPQYAALHGAVGHTVELPLRVNNEDARLPAAELRRRAAINTDVAQAAITATLRYTDAEREGLLTDHVEIFRRGAAGEPQREVEAGLFGVVGPEDVWTTQFPRAYVIPVGAEQRSAPAAARLVEHLISHGVRVGRLTAPARLAGHDLATGSYVVDLHQARRGLGHTLLGPGTDLSARVEAMYDISAWSLGLLWGADVLTVPAGDPLEVALAPVREVDAPGAIADPAPAGWVLRLDDPADVAALSELVEDGVALEWLADGTVLVPGTAVEQARAVSSRLGVVLAAAPAGARGEPLGRLRVGVAAPPEEHWALDQLGLETIPVSTASLDDGLDLTSLDVLYVSADLRWRALGAPARAALRAFVDSGGGLVAVGRHGAELSQALDRLDVEAVTGPTDANGIVAVEGPADADGMVAGGAPGHAFVDAPTWFPGAGDDPGNDAKDVVVEQRLAADPLVAGHWRGTDGDGPLEAGGHPVVVRGEAASGGRTVLIGTQPLYRAHPRGQHALVVRALLWASLGG